MRPIEELKLTLADGKERRFLLLMSGFKRLQERYKIKTLKELMALDVTNIAVPILYESLVEKDGLTEEALADLVPVYLDDLVRAIMTLLGISFPANKQDPPTPTPQIQ